MSRKVAFLAAIPLLLFATAIAAGITPGVPYDVVSGGGGASIGDGVTAATGDILNAYDYANPTALTGDSAANTGTSIQGGVNASPFATTAANKSGGPAIISGGVGTTGCSAVAGAACAGDTVTVTVTDTTGTTLAGVVLTDGGNWTHSDVAATNATNLAAAITAHASLSPYVTASAVGTAMGIKVTAGKAIGLTIASSDSVNCCTLVNGADGKVIVAYPGIQWTDPGLACVTDPDTGFLWRGNNIIDIIQGGLLTAQFGAAGAYYSYSSVTATAGVMSLADMYCGDDYLPFVSAAATDVAPVITTITTQEPIYSLTPAITNKDGGNLVLAPANGIRRLYDAGTGVMCTANPCVFAIGQTITFPIQVDGVTTSCVATSAAATNPATRSFLCNGETPTNCASNLLTAMSGVGVCPGPTLNAATSGGIFAVSRNAGYASYIGPIAVSAAGIVAQNGVDGKLQSPIKIQVGPDASVSGICLSQTANALTIGRATDCLPGSVTVTTSALASSTLQLGGGSKLQTSGLPLMLVTNNSGACGGFAEYPQTVNCDVNCGGAGVVINSNIVMVNCTNAGGCAMTLAETNWSATVAGTVTLIAGPTQTGALTVAASAGVLRLAGGVSWTPVEGGTLTLSYSPALYWVENSRSVNL